MDYCLGIFRSNVYFLLFNEKEYDKQMVIFQRILCYVNFLFDVIITKKTKNYPFEEDRERKCSLNFQNFLAFSFRRIWIFT